MAITEIEWDFLLDKDNLSPTELQERFRCCKGSTVFVKDVCDSPDTALQTAKGDKQLSQVKEGKLTPLEDFALRVKNLRQFLQDLATPRIKEIFRVRAATFDHGLEGVMTFEQFLDAFRSLPYDSNMRRIIYQVMGPMWGKTWGGEVEKMVMKKIKLAYKNFLVSGLPPKTRRSKGCVNTIITRVRQSRIVDAFW